MTKKRKKSIKRYGGSYKIKAKKLEKNLAKEEAELREELAKLDEVKRQVDQMIKIAH
jgi:hypothetical protein